MPNSTYFALLEACTQPGCPVCRVIQEVVERYLRHLFYEDVNDWGIRQTLRKSRGFCPTHTWMLLEIGIADPFGTAILYQDVLENVLKQLPSDDFSVQRPKLLSRVFRHLSRDFVEHINFAVKVLSPQAPCPACHQQRISTQNALTTLRDALSEETMMKALMASDGLCFPHLRQMFNLVRDEQDYQVLLRFVQEKVGSLQNELAELIRKHDYRFSKEGYGSEGDAWRRAMRMLSGEKNIGRSE